MQNIFPIAQRATIEETIGMKRPSASPPVDQIVKKCNVSNNADSTLKKPAALYAKPLWFSISNISEKERNILLEINQVNEIDNRISLYLEIRNQIIQQYENTSGYLPLNWVTKYENYKLATLAFNFLEDNKIINYNTDLLESISNIENSLSFDNNSDVCDNLNEKYFECKETKKIKEKYFKKEILESSKCQCGGKALYFTSDLLFICENCYINNKFATKYNSRNFHKLTEDLLSCIWTKEEDYRLLKNIEMYGDAWNKVTEGLNKSFEQCIFHFIKLPIIENVTNFPPIPFTQVPNSISTLIAFICSLVYPSISTELAKMALQHVNNQNLMDILLKSAKDKGKEVLVLERAKIEKLREVELEAMIKRVMLKVDSINEMHAEIQAVKTELEDEREKLMGEFTKFK